MATVTSLNLSTDDEKFQVNEPLPWTSPKLIKLDKDKTKWTSKLLNFDINPDAVYAFISLKANDQYLTKLTAWEQLLLPDRINWVFNTAIDFEDNNQAIEFMHHLMVHDSALPEITESYTIDNAEKDINDWLCIIRVVYCQAYAECQKDHAFKGVNQHTTILAPKFQSIKSNPKYYTNMTWGKGIQPKSISTWTPYQPVTSLSFD